MKQIIAGAAYLIAGAILAGAGVISLTINDSGHNALPPIAFIIGVLFFIISICCFASSKDNEIK